MSSKAAFSPGEYIRDELVARGWTPTDLAALIGRPFQHVHLVCRDKRRITAETAAEVAAALGTSVGVWLNLQARYDAKHAPAADPEIAARVRKLDARRKRVA